MAMIQDAPSAAYLADDPVLEAFSRSNREPVRSSGGRVEATTGLGLGRVTLQRMDNVGIVVESSDAAISSFTELGLELEGRATIEGDWAERVTGLRHMRVEIP